MALPIGGQVRIARDTGSPLFGLACATPCGGDGRCANTGGHPGFGPSPVRGVCWLGSGATAEEARARAGRFGWQVVD